MSSSDPLLMPSLLHCSCGLPLRTSVLLSSHSPTSSNLHCIQSGLAFISLGLPVLPSTVCSNRQLLTAGFCWLQVSITFDPFLYLPVPLPQKQKVLTVYYFAKEPHKKPVKVRRVFSCRGCSVWLILCFLKYGMFWNNLDLWQSWLCELLRSLKMFSGACQ